LAQGSLLESAGATDKHLTGRQVLVTGATGFIGSHLVERLVSLGARVTAVGPCLGWRPTVRDLAQQGRVRFVKLQAFWNPASLARIASEFDGVEYVVHLAYAMPRESSCLDNAIADIGRNVLGTLRFVGALTRSVSKLCFASSAMVYGPNPSQPVSETDPAHPVTAYAIGKLASEAYLRSHAAECGVCVSILRYATVYGPMETVPRAIPNFMRHVLGGKPPVIYGSGDDVRDYVHVSDVVDATVLALVHDGAQVQVFNVGTGKGYTTSEIARHIIKLADKRMEPIHKPARHVPNKIVCDVSRARDTLGYEPTVSLDQGLRDEMRFFIENPKLWRER